MEPHESPAGCGWVVVEMNQSGGDGRAVVEGSKYLGYQCTNNQAGYHGLVAGLRFVETHLDVERLYIRGDSELVIKQLSEEYYIRNHHRARLRDEAMQVINDLNLYDYRFKHVPR